MDKQAPAEFIQEFEECFNKAMKAGVPMSVIIARIEIAKVQAINQFLNERTLRQAQELAKKISESKPIITPN